MTDTLATLQAALEGRYALEREIGRGGMATVYLARDTRHNRPVAVKVLRTELAASLAVHRFLKEIETAARLNHPHIVPLLDSGDVNGVLHFVMPFVEGHSVRALLNRERPLPMETALSLATETAGALTYAHRQGLIHRDIKPENILLSEGHAVVADFGIAKALSTAGGDQLTRTGFPIGTLGYMSPEQAAGRTDLDETTDVYSLACVFYEMVVGDTPGMWVSTEALKYGRFVDAAPSHRERLDTLPGSIEPELVRAMSMDPAGRHRTPSELADALRAGASQPARFSPDQVQDIIRSASENQAAHPTTAANLSIGSVERIAAEVGLTPQRVQDAVHALEAQEDSPLPGGVLGAPARIDLERVIPGDLSPEAYETLLEEVRSTIGEVGRINETLGKSLSWNSLSFQNSFEGTGRLIHLMVTPKGQATRIRLTESAGAPPAAAVFGTFLAGSAIAGAIIGTLGLSHPGTTAGVFLSTYAVTFLGARVAFRKYIKRRVRILKGLMGRMTEHIVETAALPPPGLPAHDPDPTPPEVPSNP